MLIRSLVSGLCWVPIVNAVFISLCIFKFFYWHPVLLFWSLGVLVFSSVMALFEVLRYLEDSGVWGFLFFLGSESFIFASVLLMVCELSDGSEHLYFWKEGPLVASALLVGSSATITCFHFDYGTFFSRLFLDATSALALGFVITQGFEFFCSGGDVVCSAYLGACYCAVGLHCLHVLVGLFLMWYFLFWGLDLVRDTHVSYLVWYWHLVDVVWLFVYFLVYIL